MERERPAGGATFGELLRRHRLEAGLSQEVLAERARMSARGIGALERGDRRTPQRETVILLADALALRGEEREALEAAANPLGSRSPKRGSVTAGPWPAQPPPKALGPWLVPGAMRTRYFTGRDRLLAQLRQQLVERHRAALSGLGGVGKTQTAIEYAVRHRSDYPSGVFWVNAETIGELTSGFVKMAATLCLPAAASSDDDAAVKAALEWLNGTADWLLILDNVENRGDIQRFVPEQGQRDLLLTSRESVFAELGIPRALEVRDLDADEAVSFLLARTGLEAAVPGQGDTADAAELAAELGYLPLALEQAAAYIAVTNATFSVYLSAFRTRRVALLEKAAGLIAHDTVAVTWAANFEAVERASPAAADVLRLSALFASDAIPFELFLQGARVLGDSIAEVLADGDDLAVSELLRPLTRYSLVHSDTASRVFSMHRLVQQTVWGTLAKPERRKYVEMAVCAIDAAFPTVAYANWALSERLVAHVASIGEWLVEYDIQPETGSGVLNRAAHYLRNRGRYAEAKTLSERALAIGERAFGSDHVSIAISLNNLASVHWELGQYAEAVPLHERALAIREGALGVDHPDVAISLNNLANVHWVRGQYAEALALQQRALAIRERAFGPDHPAVGSSLDNLAVTLSSQGRYAEAGPLYERALAIEERTLGVDHPTVGNTLNNLAGIAFKYKRYAEAQALFERALAIGENAHGDHWTVAESLTGIASVYVHLGRYADAEPLYQRAVRIGERAFGSDHLYVAESLVGLATLRQEQGRIVEALALYERALTIKAKALVDDNPELTEIRTAVDALRARLTFTQ